MPRISDIMLLQQTKQYALVIKTTTSLHELGKTIGESFGKIGSYLQEVGEILTDIPFVSYIDYRNMTPDNINVMIGFPVSKPLAEKENIKSIEIPEGKIAMSMYTGDYGEITPVYDDMEVWINMNSFESTGNCFEYYYNDDKFGAENILTKVVIPLK